MKTQEQKFLDWCKKNKVKPKAVKQTLEVSDMDTKPGEQFRMTYHVEPYVKVTFAGKVMKRRDTKWVIYFDSVGRWFGGSNLLWDDSLPWMK